MIFCCISLKNRSYPESRARVQQDMLLETEAKPQVTTTIAYARAHKAPNKKKQKKRLKCGWGRDAEQHGQELATSESHTNALSGRAKFAGSLTTPCLKIADKTSGKTGEQARFKPGQNPLVPQRAPACM